VSFNLETAKARAAHWEPALHLEDLYPDTSTENDDLDSAGNLPWMVTYSAFDPGASRPFPLMSGIGVSMAIPQEKLNTIITTPFKPWPYSLPAFLQPRPGTTFSLMNRSTAVGPPKSFGILQAVLYGVPQPEKFSFAREVVAPGSFLDKILHGVKEMNTGDEIVAVAKVTALKDDGDGVVVVGVEVKAAVGETLTASSKGISGVIAD